MKNIVLFLVLILTYNISGAQVPDLVFIGTVTLKEGDVYTYKLQFSDSAGILKGYSITDIRGKNETKTAIKGTIDQAKKQITVNETKIISTKSSSEKTDFCFIHARLKISESNGATMLKGNFEGYKEDSKTPCDGGKLLLFNAKDVLDKLLAETAKDTTAKPTPAVVKKPEKIVQVTYEKEIPAADILKVAPGKIIEVQCPQPTVTVDVWDAETIDGDIITLLQDNKPLLQNYSLTGNSKELNINMDNRQTDTLTLIAISEGTEPTNTARLKITSGVITSYIDATTTLDKKVLIMLKRKQ